MEVWPGFAMGEMAKMEEMMGNRGWRKLVFVLFCPALLLFATHAGAVSLEKIEVASHLGEPFFAEVLLKLENNELASKVFVEIAAPSDYKIFEVYRDPILKSIRADVASDKRGVRVELSSRSRIKAPFFNLVLKIRYGRVSHFKKFPVFLDAAKSISQAAVKEPQPTVEAIKQPASAMPRRTSLTKSAGQTFIPEPSTAPEVPVKPEAKYYEGWARIDRYGPIVRGDTLSTVAERLRIDYRYTRNQIMLALFEKNSSSFDQNNINLLKAGSRLKVPTAAEVEKHNKAEASQFLAKQEKDWKKLTQQPRFAAEKEAQRTRYTKRISVGEHADGVALAPVDVAVADKPDVPAQIRPPEQTQAKVKVSDVKPAPPLDLSAPAVPPVSQTAAIAAAVTQAQAESSQMLDDLRQQNALFQKQQADHQKSIEALNRKVENDAVTAAAAKAHLEKLEILISRLQSELEKVEQQRAAPVTAGMNWVIWLLIALVVILLVVVAMMMRREPAHPAVAMESSATDETARVIPEGQSEALESVIEHEVAGIETGESEIPLSKDTATIDSLPVFTDELSDTDTAELEPFDADANAEPDPDIDYMAEADVYIRYGMDDEAVKQLDMALRLQPDNVEAHIKKAELLLGKSDKPGLDESVAAATMTLTALDLDRFKASIEKLGAEVEQQFSETEVQKHAELNETIQDTLPLDASAADDLDFNLSDLDVPDIEGDKQRSAQDQPDDLGAGETEDMSWLHDAAFDGDVSQNDEPGFAQQTGSADVQASPTQELDNLLTELSDNESGLTTEEQLVTTDLPGATSTEDLPDFDVTGGATQELDHLLTEFSEQETIETATVEDNPLDINVPDINPIEVDQAEVDQAEVDQAEVDQAEVDQAEVDRTDESVGATRRLDQLLSEFDDDDDNGSFVDTQTGLDESIFKQDIDKTDTTTTESVDIDPDHGATQELDSLLAEFSDADEDQLIIGDDTGELDAPFFESAKSASPDKESTIGMDTDHGATQELDSLLSEFSNEEEQTLDIDQAGTDTISGGGDSEHGATQVLGHLLDEFNDGFEDDDEEKKKS